MSDVETGPSSIEGLGLFAARPFSVGHPEPTFVHNNIRKAERVTNRLLYQLSYVGLVSILTAKWRSVKSRPRVARPRSCRCRAHQRIVFLLRLSGQQHPKRVDPERSTDGNVEQSDETQNEREDSRPRLMVH